MNKLGKLIQMMALLILPVSLWFIHYHPSEGLSIEIFAGSVLLFGVGTLLRGSKK